MTDYFEREKERIARMHAETAHEQHQIEFREMCNQMIEDALKQHDQQVDINVKTTLNGKPCTMAALVSDVKKQLYAAFRKAHK